MLLGYWPPGFASTAVFENDINVEELSLRKLQTSLPSTSLLSTGLYPSRMETTLLTGIMVTVQGL